MLWHKMCFEWLILADIIELDLYFKQFLDTLYFICKQFLSMRQNLEFKLIYRIISFKIRIFVKNLAHDTDDDLYDIITFLYAPNWSIFLANKAISCILLFCDNVVVVVEFLLSQTNRCPNFSYFCFKSNKPLFFCLSTNN
jgi:hypothetical protein